MDQVGSGLDTDIGLAQVIFLGIRATETDFMADLGKTTFPVGLNLTPTGEGGWVASLENRDCILNAILIAEYILWGRRKSIFFNER